MSAVAHTPGLTFGGRPLAPRQPLSRLAYVELRKAVDTRAGMWLLIVTALAAVGLVAITVTAGKAQDATWADLFSGTQWVVSLLVPVIGILLVTSEWSQRTALTTFSLVPDRRRTILAKVLAATVLALAVVLVCIVLSAIGAAVGSAADPWNLRLADVGTGALYQVTSMIIGLAFGLVLMSSPLAIVVYFVLPTVWSILGEAIHALQSVAEWLDLSQAMEPLVEGGVSATEWAKAATALALWLGVPLVLGLIRLSRHEVK
jgi:ABC-type transport system involved in multi-copper enzyme maturation permease subunit